MSFPPRANASLDEVLVKWTLNAKLSKGPSRTPPEVDKHNVIADQRFLGGEIHIN